MRFATTALLAGFLLAPTTAHAIRPDFDGERGFEGWLTAGYGSFTGTSVREFESVSDASVMTGTPPEVMYGGFTARLGAGWRFSPLVSAGITGAYQFLGGDRDVVGGRSIPTHVGAYSVGVYARFYPMPLITHSLSERRVRMDGWSLRRLDPWVSLGVEYAGIWRSETDPGSPLEGSSWTRGAVAVPVALGFDVRVLAALAVGVTFGLSPTIGATTEQDSTMLDTSSNVHHTNRTFDKPDTVDVGWNIGLGVRYTLTP